MKIGQIIREKRRARGLTQEQVAQALGVSAPAVSKWEGDLSFPDITLLPRLARLLGTDLNGLLAFQETLSRQEVGDFLHQLSALDLTQALALAREKVGQYPNCALLALNTALTLEGQMALQGGGREEDRAWLLSLYHQAAASQEEEVATPAKAILFRRCLEDRDYAQAQQLLEALPRQPLFRREQMEASLAQAQGNWNQAGAQLEAQLMQQVIQLRQLLWDLMDLATQEGALQRLAPLEERALALTGLFGQWDFEEQSIRLHRACLEQDVTAGLAAVAGLLDSLEKPWQPQQDLYAHLPQQDPGPFLAQLRPGILRELRDPAEHRYDFLRREQAFWDMVGR